MVRSLSDPGNPASEVNIVEPPYHGGLRQKNGGPTRSAIKTQSEELRWMYFKVKTWRIKDREILRGATVRDIPIGSASDVVLSQQANKPGWSIDSSQAYSLTGWPSC
jgi:hypothetical protein